MGPWHRSRVCCCHSDHGSSDPSSSALLEFDAELETMEVDILRCTVLVCSHLARTHESVLPGHIPLLVLFMKRLAKRTDKNHIVRYTQLTLTNLVGKDLEDIIEYILLSFEFTENLNDVVKILNQPVQEIYSNVVAYVRKKLLTQFPESQGTETIVRLDNALAQLEERKRRLYCGSYRNAPELEGEGLIRKDWIDEFCDEFNHFCAAWSKYELYKGVDRATLKKHSIGYKQDKLLSDIGQELPAVRNFLSNTQDWQSV